MGATVEELDRYGLNPTDPGPCRVGYESVTVCCQAAGSVPVAGQTLARIVVGDAPVTCNLTFTAAELVVLTAGTMICGLRVTTVAEPASEVSSSPSWPSDRTITRAEYSRFVPVCRPMKDR